MGTALTAAAPVIIRGPEHWCSGFHQWDCAGVAIRGPVTGGPFGALDISVAGLALLEGGGQRRS
jgi:transcriptional regulator of acetoin/glycerol metabolism